MSVCSNCGSPIPEEAKFCPVCGTPVPAEPVVEEPVVEEAVPAEPAAEEIPAPQEAPAAGWYQSADQQQTVPPAAPVYAAVKPAIGGIFDYYRKAFAVLVKKPIKLWGLSLLYLLIASLIASLGSFVPIISIPIVLVLALGFTGVLLRGYHGEEVHSVQLFEGFKKEEVVRNGAGMCWKELWMLLTDKEISATEALKKSMRMTDGCKGKLFGADVLCVLGFFLAMIVLVLLGRIPYIGWIFAIAAFLLYLAYILFAPLFMGLVRTAIFEDVNAVHEE